MDYNLSHINSVEALQREKKLIRQRIKIRENDLRLKMYEIPGELAAAGANTFIPKILRGKITNAALNGGKKIINKFFVPEDEMKQNLLIEGAKKSGSVITLIKNGIKLFRSKR